MPEKNGGLSSFRFNLLDIIFMPECPVCHRRIEYLHVCESCTKAMELAQPEEEFKTYSKEIGLKNKIPFAFCYYYDFEPVKRFIKYIKVYYHKRIIMHAAIKMCAEVHSFRLNGRTLFVNVPRTEANYRKYGFDQAEYLARQISKLYSEDCEYRYLVRRRLFAKEQKTLNAVQRFINAKSSFRISKLKMAGIKTPDNIVIVDDIITTGASVCECAAVLKKTFPNARIVALSFAYAGLNNGLETQILKG